PSPWCHFVQQDRLTELWVAHNLLLERLWAASDERAAPARHTGSSPVARTGRAFARPATLWTPVALRTKEYHRWLLSTCCRVRRSARPTPTGLTPSVPRCPDRRSPRWRPQHRHPRRFRPPPRAQ